MQFFTRFWGMTMFNVSWNLETLSGENYEKCLVNRDFDKIEKSDQSDIIWLLSQ